MEIKRSNRGFEYIEFTDYYDNQCSFFEQLLKIMADIPESKSMTLKFEKDETGYITIKKLL